jgi:hypothetical protein
MVRFRRSMTKAMGTLEPSAEEGEIRRSDLEEL